MRLDGNLKSKKWAMLKLTRLYSPMPVAAYYLTKIPPLFAVVLLAILLVKLDFLTERTASAHALDAQLVRLEQVTNNLAFAVSQLVGHTQKQTNGADLVSHLMQPGSFELALNSAYLLLADGTYYRFNGGNPVQHYLVTQDDTDAAARPLSLVGTSIWRYYFDAERRLDWRIWPDPFNRSLLVLTLPVATDISSRPQLLAISFEPAQWLAALGPKLNLAIRVQEDILYDTSDYPSQVTALVATVGWSDPALSFQHWHRAQPWRYLYIGLAVSALLMLIIKLIETPQRQLQQDLRQALKIKAFSLHYQAIVELNSNRCVGAEALIRWPASNLKPEQFICVAEQTGLIHGIGFWVLETALAQLQRWRNERLEIGYLSVNLSIIQLADPEFLNKIDALLARYPIRAGEIILEITESVLIQQDDAEVLQLSQLRARGFHLALDDFGTGCSPLSNVKNLPINVLKIDRSFIAGIPDNRYDASICTAIIQMAKALDLQLVAEGVETPRQLAWLQAQGVTAAQGFFFTKAVSASDFRAHISSPRPDLLPELGAS